MVAIYSLLIFQYIYSREFYILSIFQYSISIEPSTILSTSRTSNASSIMSILNISSNPNTLSLGLYLKYSAFLILISILQTLKSSLVTCILGSALCGLNIKVCNVLYFMSSYKKNSYCLICFLSFLTLEFLYFIRIQIQIFKPRNFFRPTSIDQPHFEYINIVILSKSYVKYNHTCINNYFSNFYIYRSFLYLWIFLSASKYYCISPNNLHLQTCPIIFKKISSIQSSINKISLLFI